MKDLERERRELKAGRYLERQRLEKLKRNADILLVINLSTRIILVFLFTLFAVTIFKPSTGLQVFAILFPSIIGGVFFAGLFAEIEGRLYSEITKPKAK